MKDKSFNFIKNLILILLRRTNWSLYSMCNLWQQLVDDTKQEAKQRGIIAEVYGNHIASSITTRCSSLQKITKKVNFFFFIKQFLFVCLIFFSVVKLAF